MDVCTRNIMFKLFQILSANLMKIVLKKKNNLVSLIKIYLEMANKIAPGNAGITAVSYNI